MIVYGGYEFEREEPERYAAKTQGALMAVLEHDRVHRLWATSGFGWDLLLALITARTGARHLMGRVRVTVDDKLHGSKDRKHGIHIVFPPSMSRDELISITPSMIDAITQDGYGGRREPLTEIKIDGGPQGLVDAIEHLAMHVPGWDFSHIDLSAQASKDDDPR